jgi:hypothetical protein
MIRQEWDANDLQERDAELLKDLFGDDDVAELLWGEDGSEMNTVIITMEKK